MTFQEAFDTFIMEIVTWVAIQLDCKNGCFIENSNPDLIETPHFSSPVMLYLTYSHQKCGTGFALFS